MPPTPLNVEASSGTAPRGQFIQLRQVSKDYRRGRVTVPALDRLDLSIEEGDFVAVMGSSGCGKTTLLNMIAGLDRPTAGEVLVGGMAVNRLDGTALAQWRSRNVGVVFQFYNLLPALTAEQNVALPLLLHPMSRAKRQERVENVLEIVGLRDRRSHRPDELSGGQQQRVAIARALVTDARLLLCDEPTGDLDRESSGRIMEILRLLNAEHGKTILVATHDPEAAEFARRSMQLDKSCTLPMALDRAGECQ